MSSEPDSPDKPSVTAPKIDPSAEFLKLLGMEPTHPQFAEMREALLTPVVAKLFIRFPLLTALFDYFLQQELNQHISAAVAAAKAEWDADHQGEIERIANNASAALQNSGKELQKVMDDTIEVTAKRLEAERQEESKANALLVLTAQQQALLAGHNMPNGVKSFMNMYEMFRMLLKELKKLDLEALSKAGAIPASVQQLSALIAAAQSKQPETFPSIPASPDVMPMEDQPH